MTSLDSCSQYLESYFAHLHSLYEGELVSQVFCNGGWQRERDAVREQVPRGQDDARDQAVVTSFTFLIVAVVGGSDTIFLAFTLSSLVIRSGCVFFCIL